MAPKTDVTEPKSMEFNGEKIDPNNPTAETIKNKFAELESGHHFFDGVDKAKKEIGTEEKKVTKTCR